MLILSSVSFFRTQKGRSFHFLVGPLARGMACWSSLPPSKWITFLWAPCHSHTHLPALGRRRHLQLARACWESCRDALANGWRVLAPHARPWKVKKHRKECSLSLQSFLFLANLRKTMSQLQIGNEYQQESPKGGWGAATRVKNTLGTPLSASFHTELPVQTASGSLGKYTDYFKTFQASGPSQVTSALALFSFLSHYSQKPVFHFGFCFLLQSNYS